MLVAWACFSECSAEAMLASSWFSPASTPGRWLCRRPAGLAPGWSKSEELRQPQPRAKLFSSLIGTSARSRSTMALRAESRAMDTATIHKLVASPFDNLPDAPGKCSRQISADCGRRAETRCFALAPSPDGLCGTCDCSPEGRSHIHSPGSPQSAAAFQSYAGNGRGISRRRSSPDIRSSLDLRDCCPDKRRSVSRPNRCRCRWLTQTGARKPLRRSSDRDRAPPFARSVRHFALAEIFGPAPATCTSSIRVHTSAELAACDKARDWPDRKRRNPTLARC